MEVHPNSHQAYTLLHEGILSFARAERTGITLDMPYVLKTQRRLNERIGFMEVEFYKSKLFKHWQHSVRGRINIYSHTQLRHYLYDVRKIEPTKYTSSGEGSTSEEALKELNMPELTLLIDIRKMKKVQEVLDGFEREQVGGIIHPHYNLHLVRTFRSSSDSPNMQNNPKRDEEMARLVRKAIKARPGHQLVEIDYSGLEVRIAACYHKDPVMLQYINDPSSDMHADMASEIYKININKSIPSHKILRNGAKNGFVFPQFYGDYYKNCAKILAGRWGGLPSGRWKSGEGIQLENNYLADHLISQGLKSYDKFVEHVKDIEADFWNKRFRKYARWKDNWWENYQEVGYIDMFTGFRCSGVMGRNDCINYPIQGSAFHCLLWSFNELDRVQRVERWDTRLIGQIHDSIILDVHPNELERVMNVSRRITCVDLPREWPWIIVPLDVEIEIHPVDGSWADKVD